MAAVESKQLDPVVARLRGVAKQYQRGNEVVPVLDDPKDLFGGTLAGCKAARPRKRKTA